MPTCTAERPALTPGQLLERVDGWVWTLAYRFASRVRLSPEDFAHELRVDIFLHADKYDRDRGRVTTWVMWRCRSVMTRFTKKRRRAITTVDITREPVARPDRDAAGGRVERAEDLVEIAAGVRRAVGRLAPARRADVTAVFGIGGEGDGMSCGEVAAAAGKSRRAVYADLDVARDQMRGDRRLRELAERHGLLSPAAG